MSVTGKLEGSNMSISTAIRKAESSNANDY